VTPAPKPLMMQPTHADKMIETHLQSCPSLPITTHSSTLNLKSSYSRTELVSSHPSCRPTIQHRCSVTSEEPCPSLLTRLYKITIVLAQLLIHIQDLSKTFQSLSTIFLSTISLPQSPSQLAHTLHQIHHSSWVAQYTTHLPTPILILDLSVAHGHHPTVLKKPSL